MKIKENKGTIDTATVIYQQVKKADIKGIISKSFLKEMKRAKKNFLIQIEII